MFLVIGCCCAFLLFQQAPSVTAAVLLVLLAWASARFYYFLFYVLERYVDPTMRYSGITDLVVTIVRRLGKSESTGA